MIVEFDTYPMGKESGLGKDIAEVKKIIESSGLDHQLTAMGTIIEGGWDEVMGVIKKCHHQLKEDYVRVETHIKVDDHGDKSGRIKGKIDAVEKHL
ncbi:MAG: MTH1187 family thiamine-binding protein [Candidatus Bipolaricaulia bacterium]